MSVPQDISWALARNPDILQILLLEYPHGHGYWDYLDELVAYLRKANCEGIQDKMVDVGNNNLGKFESTVSELEIARLLSERGKHVKLLPDSYLKGRSPDMHVSDANGDYYVEVVRFSDDEAVAIIQDELVKYLATLSRPYRVDVSLPRDLSIPATGYQERDVKEGKAREVLRKFKESLSTMNLSQIPSCIDIDGVTFHFSTSRIGRGFTGIINSEVIIVPSEKFVGRIRYLLTDPERGKAVKRKTWIGDDLKIRYIVAIECEQPYVHEEEVEEALLGRRETYPQKLPSAEIPVEVKEAAEKNWTRFLERVHMIPKDRTIFKSYGAYLTDPICNNVSGVLVYKRLVPRSNSMICFLPNPFADDAINDSTLLNFL